jgi:hypothetical protein
MVDQTDDAAEAAADDGSENAEAYDVSRMKDGVFFPSWENMDPYVRDLDLRRGDATLRKLEAFATDVRSLFIDADYTKSEDMETVGRYLFGAAAIAALQIEVGADCLVSCGAVGGPAAGLWAQKAVLYVVRLSSVPGLFSRKPKLRFTVQAQDDADDVGVTRWKFELTGRRLTLATKDE